MSKRTVKCLVCNEEFQSLALHLLKVHKISTGYYLLAFPFASLTSPDCYIDRDDEAIAQGVSDYWANTSEEEYKEWINNLSKSHTGLKDSDETRKRKSKSVSEAWSDPDLRARHSASTSKRMVEVWKRPEYRELMTKIHKDLIARDGPPKRQYPTIPEEAITFTLNSNFPGQWEYTGDKPFKDGGSCRPDWTHTSRNLVLEYFSYFWHSSGIMNSIQDPNDKTKHYEDLGYYCLLIEDEDKDDPFQLVNKVADFLKKYT